MFTNTVSEIFEYAKASLPIIYGSAKVILPVILTIPGLIAFYWTWKDRGFKRAGESPYGTWKIDPIPDANGWYETKFSIKNRWDEPLYATKVTVKGNKHATLFFQSDTSPQRTEAELGEKVLHVRWEFLPSSQTGDRASSGGTKIFLRLAGCPEGNSPLAQQPSQNPPSATDFSQDVSQQSGTSSKPSPVPVEISQAMRKLRLVVSLNSASNRRMQCKIQSSWNKVSQKTNTPAKPRAPIAPSIWL